MVIRVMLVDDHEIIREGIKQLLELDGEIIVVGEAGDGESYIQSVTQCAPDVVLLDINMPKMNGLEVLKEMKERRMKYKVIVLTVHTEIDYLLKAVEIGVDGYLLKDSSLSELKKAILTVYEGDTYIQPELIPPLNAKKSSLSAEQELIQTLTKREYEILKLLASGYSNREAGVKLSISERTVKNHVTQVFKKLNVKDRTQAAVFAIRNNILNTSVSNVSRETL